MAKKKRPRRKASQRSNNAQQREQNQSGSADQHESASDRATPVDENNEQRNEDSASQQHGSQAGDNWEKRHSLRMLQFNGLLAFFSIIGAGLIFWQIIEMRLGTTAARDANTQLLQAANDANDISAKSANESRNAVQEANGIALSAVAEASATNEMQREVFDTFNRARVHFINATLRGTIDDDPTVILMELKNSGTVPAERVSFDITRTFTNRKTKARLNVVSKDKEEIEWLADIPPGNSIIYVPELFKIGTEVMQQIRDGRVHMLAYGVINYEDEFGKRKPVPYAFEWNHHLTSFTMANVRMVDKDANQDEDEDPQ